MTAKSPAIKVTKSAATPAKIPAKAAAKTPAKTPTKSLAKVPAKAKEAAVVQATGLEEVATPVTKAPSKAAAAKAAKAALADLGATSEVAVVSEAGTEAVASVSKESVSEIDSLSQEVKEIKEDRALKLIPELLGDIDRNQFKIGGLLSRVSSEGWYQDKGFETFKAFVEATYGMKYRKAMYLIQIYNSLVASGVPWDKVKHLGWTKLVIIINYLNKDNVDEWLAEVDGLTADQIKALVAEKTKGTKPSAQGDNGGIATLTSMTFKLHQDQKATIRAALDKNRHESGTQYDTVALENICLDYLGQAPVITSLQDTLRNRSLDEILEAVDALFPTTTITVQTA